VESKEFDQIFYEAGINNLERHGFVFKNTGWHKITDEFQLSFLCVNDANIASYSARVLTIAFNRFATVLEKDQKRSILETPDLVSPIQVNPFKLRGYVESGFEDDVWHFSKINGKETKELAYGKLYYGGKEKRPLTSVLSKKKTSFQKRLEAIGIGYISEKETTNRVYGLAKDVADYGYDFCNQMSIDEIVHQIAKYGCNLPVEKMWLEKYGQVQ